MEARIQTGSLPAVGWSVLFAFLGDLEDAEKLPLIEWFTVFFEVVFEPA